MKDFQDFTDPRMNETLWRAGEHGGREGLDRQSGEQAQHGAGGEADTQCCTGGQGSREVAASGVP